MKHSADEIYERMLNAFDERRGSPGSAMRAIAAELARLHERIDTRFVAVPDLVEQQFHTRSDDGPVGSQRRTAVVIAERYRAGDSIAFLAEDYGKSEDTIALVIAAYDAGAKEQRHEATDEGSEGDRPAEERS